MKTTAFIFLSILVATFQAFGHSIELPDLIEVNATNCASHGMTVSIALTTDDMGEPGDLDDRVVTVRVPILKNGRRLTSISLLLTPPNKHLSVPLRFKTEKDVAVVDFSIDISVLQAATVFADYALDKDDLGASHLIRLQSFVKQDMRDQNKASEDIGASAPNPQR